ncbi:MAG: glycosyltransferase [Bacteroidetes bacterium]|nr:glycosyltransferase [Bacteroidota bacterium]MBP6412104.1 glycosyltransferase [Bacteroidia bacterium]
MPEILFITSYPPRECGIATYSQDLVRALNSKFYKSFKLSICALETELESHTYLETIKYKLNTSEGNNFLKLAFQINKNEDIQLVLVQHEFGFFEKRENEFISFLNNLDKPVILTFHTILPQPGELVKKRVQQMSAAVQSILVMTHISADLLVDVYGIERSKISVIAHGTHLVPHSDKNTLKRKYELSGKMVLSTFGLIGSGKGIETTLEALPAIVERYRDVVFLVIGKTHPGVLKTEGEAYRLKLEARVAELQMQNHVQFINYFLPQAVLLEFLQLTDIYLFTSKDPNQAVSGTFSYAISCGCPVISTPIPHAQEVINGDSGILIEFNNSSQLGDAVIQLLEDESMRKRLSSNGLHKMASTAWENAAIAHALLFEKFFTQGFQLNYSTPKIKLDHIKKMTTDFGIVQFAVLNHPDMQSGYTLDDNARALIAACQHYEKSTDESILGYIHIYFNFIKFCLQPEGYFLNYVNELKQFTEQNSTTNLADSNGRAIWALGYMLHLGDILPDELQQDAEQVMQKSLTQLSKIHSTRAMAFAIKGLYYSSLKKKTTQDVGLIKELANRLVQMYRHESSEDWQWFESYLTYANSLLPEALLCAWLITKEDAYQKIAKSSFDFLLTKTISAKRIHVISNKNWFHKGSELQAVSTAGEQPIDVAYTILALDKFYEVFNENKYKQSMEIAFTWFLGNNQLNQIMYNTCTGGCYDGLEEKNVNLNQGAESTVSYLMARFTYDKSILKESRTILSSQLESRSNKIMEVVN